jgi:hypothetical protein
MASFANSFSLLADDSDEEGSSLTVATQSSSDATSWTIPQVQQRIGTLDNTPSEQILQERFHKHKTTGNILMPIEDSDLEQELGVTSGLERKRILAARDALKESKKTTERRTNSMDEVKQADNDNNMAPLLGLLGLFHHGYSVAWWTRIFSYLKFTEYEQMELRFSCRLYSKVLKPPPLLWTTYPHPNYSSLAGLFKRLNQLYKEEKASSAGGSAPVKVPSLLLIGPGVHREAGREKWRQSGRNVKYDSIGNYVALPIMIVGAGRDLTFVEGSFRCFSEKTDGEVVMKEMTVRKAKITGLDGRNFTCINMNFTECGNFGVTANGTNGKLIDCQATKCGLSGIYCYHDAVIEVFGEKTKVNGNCFKGEKLDPCDGGRTHRANWPAFSGIHAGFPSSKIILHSPLTKQMVSTNNFGGANWGGTIECQ